MELPKALDAGGIREIFAVIEMGKELKQLHRRRAEVARQLSIVESDLAIREMHVKQVYREEYLKQKNEDARRMYLQARLAETQEYSISAFNAEDLKRQLIVIDGDIAGLNAHLNAIEVAYKQMQLYNMFMEAVAVRGLQPDKFTESLEKLADEIWGNNG